MESDYRPTDYEAQIHKRSKLSGYSGKFSRVQTAVGNCELDRLFISLTDRNRPVLRRICNDGASESVTLSVHSYATSDGFPICQGSVCGARLRSRDVEMPADDSVRGYVNA